MSRVGKTKIQLPEGVTVDLKEGVFSAKGKLGQGKLPIHELLTVVIDGKEVTVTPKDQTQRARSLWGGTQRNLQNLVTGIHEGFSVNLNLEGVGYRANVQGKTLVLQLGFSHDINFPIPEGITIVCEKPTAIKVSGSDKQLVGEVAALIRKKRKPEPYKGKGVIREGEFVVRKEGKKK